MTSILKYITANLLSCSGNVSQLPLRKYLTLRKTSTLLSYFIQLSTGYNQSNSSGRQPVSWQLLISRRELTENIFFAFTMFLCVFCYITLIAFYKDQSFERLFVHSCRYCQSDLFWFPDCIANDLFYWGTFCRPTFF